MNESKRGTVKGGVAAGVRRGGWASSYLLDTLSEELLEVSALTATDDYRPGAVGGPGHGRGRSLFRPGARQDVLYLREIES